MDLNASSIDKELSEIKSKSENLKRISGKVTFAELFTEDFLSKHSQYKAISDLLNDCGFTLDDPEALNALKNGAFDVEISSRTDFSGWDEMRSAAVRSYVANKISK